MAEDHRRVRREVVVAQHLAVGGIRPLAGDLGGCGAAQVQHQACHGHDVALSVGPLFWHFQMDAGMSVVSTLCCLVFQACLYCG